MRNASLAHSAALAFRSGFAVPSHDADADFGDGVHVDDSQSAGHLIDHDDFLRVWWQDDQLGMIHDGTVSVIQMQRECAERALFDGRVDLREDHDLMNYLSALPLPPLFLETAS